MVENEPDHQRYEQIAAQKALLAKRHLAGIPARERANAIRSTSPKRSPISAARAAQSCASTDSPGLRCLWLPVLFEIQAGMQQRIAQNVVMAKQQRDQQTPDRSGRRNVDLLSVISER